MYFVDKEESEQEYLHKELTESVIKIFYKVYRKMGYGFVESVYQNAMFFALQDAGFSVEAQKDIEVFYEKHKVGYFRADIVVNDLLILELKAVDTLNESHIRQLSNYLKATNIEVGLLLNFGERAQVRRWIFTNDRK